ncbi:MAG: methyl-accepting chemotaxis protein [Sphingomonas sp.]|uniref:methyl-accepting chemotaxis protein n=1 Tax=Sphingomonas sp. TaxID=28214 RepID=UPI0035A99A55|nr:methyl-accepting chemotaxis protein [Sphingomonas sp.]
MPALIRQLQKMPMVGQLRAVRALFAIDGLSRADRVAATMRMALRFAPLNLVTAIGMAALYAFRVQQPLILVATLPIIAAVVGLIMLTWQDRLQRRLAAPDQGVRFVNGFALAIGLAWFVLIGALNMAPLNEDRVGLFCVNVAVICLGGTIFTLLPEAALIFMGVVAIRLTMDLTAIVPVPAFYVAAIIAFVGALQTLAIGQARLFADRTRAGIDLAALERRRIDAERRAADDQRALERAHEQRRIAEQQRAADAQQMAMAEHAQRFDTSVVAVIAILSDAARELGGSTAKLTKLGEASGTHVSAVRTRALTVTQSMADVQRAAGDLRAAIGAIAQEVTAQVNATASAETVSALARAQARELADSSAMVRGITAKIERIAQRTNTLALNALIEATQSGEAGAAFAVVAGEVKALAAQTRAAALEIGEHIADMDSNAGDVAASVDAMANDVGRIAIGATDIARAIEAQRRATDGILGGVDGARDGAQTVQADLQALADHAQAAVGLAHLIERVATDIGTQSDQLGSASAAFGERLRGR